MLDHRIEEIRAVLPKVMTADWVRLGARLVRLLRDRRHPDQHDAILNRLLDQARASFELRKLREMGVPRPAYPPELPITSRKDEIVEAIRANQVVVIAGETGSGKTTQIPKMCLEAGLGIEAKIGCTQPRRVAALSISRRIAEELNVAWGREVGCKIRFDDRSSRETYIKLMTDGILLAETQGDPLLSEYNAIIIDEAHERSLNIDFLLGWLKSVLAKRREMKLIITSATINTQAFSEAFGGCPIIEVSGRVYPVEVIYAPFDAASEESGEVTYIDAAVSATEEALSQTGAGDVLIFMPGERDIKETSDLLRARRGDSAEIIPLYGRLSSGDQQRVFAPSNQRKIIVATNIAETSLTIPGIRYVIDAGLARISRYNTRTRTRRLPIEAISQSSADQRKGRSGRVSNGVCIRLYSEEDFSARPPYTQPEIQRANLAEVILRMKAFRLGDIETFPFLNPPTPAAIQGGYALLQELGALNESRELTPLGGDLARLPIDPTLGRMLLQSQKEHATRELLIIASGLSIQDPRERPIEQKDAANAAHRRFLHPESDFLTLLNVWNAVHDEWERLGSQNQRRKFCKANFLSYLRMREWQDLHAQLQDALEELRTLRLSESSAAPEAVHRSILAGLLGHVATRTERNTYKTAGNRQLAIFPGSVLHEKAAKTRKGGVEAQQKPGEPKPKVSAQPEWIMAGEIVETSQVFARTLAGIDPEWIIGLAPHLCRITYENPHWEVGSGRVVATEKTHFYGLELRKRRAAYGPVAPKEATAIFIRSALVEDQLLPEETGDEQPLVVQRSKHRHRVAIRASVADESVRHQRRYPFLEHNRQVRQKIENWQTRMRRHDLPDLDQALFNFYSERIEGVSSIAELNRFLNGHADQSFLQATEQDLLLDRELSYDAEAFPDAVKLNGQEVFLSYAYRPGEDHDGVTLRLPVSLAKDVPSAAVAWAVPGLREPQVAELLRALPKALRRELMPLAPKAAEIARELQPAGSALGHDLSRFVRQRYGVAVPPAAWSAEALPQHLRPRMEILGENNKAVAVGRDLNTLRVQLAQIESKPVEAPTTNIPWNNLVQKWERFGLTDWSFDDLPETILLAETPQGAVYAWPGLQFEQGAVNLRLYNNVSDARNATRCGFPRLLEAHLQRDLAWLHKDLRALARLEPLFRDSCSLEQMVSSAFENLRRYLIGSVNLQSLSEKQFRDAVTRAKERLPGLAIQLVDYLEPILKLRSELLRRAAIVSPARGSSGRVLTDFSQIPIAVPAAAKPSWVQVELAALLPSGWLESIAFERLPHLPRYLKALLVRSERAAMNPVKDRERARQVAPFVEAFCQLRAAVPRGDIQPPFLDELRWLIEEFKVSLFAQELGTACPVSPKRLDEQFQAAADSLGIVLPHTTSALGAAK